LKRHHVPGVLDAWEITDPEEIEAVNKDPRGGNTVSVNGLADIRKYFWSRAAVEGARCST